MTGIRTLVLRVTYPVFQPTELTHHHQVRTGKCCQFCNHFYVCCLLLYGSSNPFMGPMTSNTHLSHDEWGQTLSLAHCNIICCISHYMSIISRKLASAPSHQVIGCSSPPLVTIATPGPACGAIYLPTPQRKLPHSLDC